MRGMLTKSVQAEAVNYFGRAISQRELRLMPYIQFVMMNNQRIEPNKVNQDERDILSLWRAEGHIEGGAGGLAITKDFWDAINQLMWLAYVSCD